MLPENTLQSYITSALATIVNEGSFEAVCKLTPALAQNLCDKLKQHNLPFTQNKHPDKPFVEVEVELIEEKWQETFWWGQSYLSIKISKLAPVFVCEKAMIQLDSSVEGSEVNAWQHLASEREAAIREIVITAATATAFKQVTNELSREVDTGTIALNAHYRKWKPTVHAVFFEKII